jgi:hypothetical protein
MLLVGTFTQHANLPIKLEYKECGSLEGANAMNHLHIDLEDWQMAHPYHHLSPYEPSTRCTFYC